MNENTKILVAVLASVMLSIVGMGILVTLDTPIRDSLIGPQGIQGMQGLQGIGGTQGNQGVQGEAGPQGIAITGPQGIQGEPGEQGDSGIQGPIGPIGATGPEGLMLPEGDHWEEAFMKTWKNTELWRYTMNLHVEASLALLDWNFQGEENNAYNVFIMEIRYNDNILFRVCYQGDWYADAYYLYGPGEYQVIITTLYTMEYLSVRAQYWT